MCGIVIIASDVSIGKIVEKVSNHGICDHWPLYALYTYHEYMIG